MISLEDTGESAVSQPDHQRPRARDIGIQVGILPIGLLNAITDVEGVKVGHKTLWQGDAIQTGVTVIVPHEDNLFQQKVPAAIYLGNALGSWSARRRSMSLVTSRRRSR